MGGGHKMKQKEHSMKDVLGRHVFFLFMSLILLFFTGIAAASTPNITVSSDWETRGTASFSGAGAVIGDTIGYDSGNQDHDGNYENSGRAGSKIDYDFIISKAILAPPATLEWTGCLPVTRYGYNMFGLGNLYKGGIYRQAVFQTRWEKQTAIQVFIGSGGSSYLAGISPTTGQFCADYRLEWKKNGNVIFFYNNQQVWESSKAIDAPLVFFTRTFEKPATIASLTITSSAEVSPVMEPCSADPSSGPVPLRTTVTCRASGSGPLTWSWDWDTDGIPEEITQIDHAQYQYDPAGTYNLTVTVTDALGQQAQKSLQIVALGTDASSPHGTVGGVFTGTVQMPGSSKQVSGDISGSWDAKIDAAGNLAATAQGTFGADDISGVFEASYNPATGQLRGSWGDTEGDIFSHPLTFVPQGDGIHFSAPITGLIPTSDGGLPFEGQIQLELLRLPEASASGTVDGTFSADIAYTVNGSVLYSGVQIPVNLADTIPTSGQVSGSWRATSTCGTATGEANGQFSGTIDTSVATPIGSHPIHIPYSGNWQGDLSVSGTTITFAGSWLEPHIQAMGSADSSFGGGFGISLDNSSGTWPIPITFTCPPSGGTYVDPDSGLLVHWELQNFSGTGTCIKTKIELH